MRQEGLRKETPSSSTSAKVDFFCLGFFGGRLLQGGWRAARPPGWRAMTYESSKTRGASYCGNDLTQGPSATVLDGTCVPCLYPEMCVSKVAARETVARVSCPSRLSLGIAP